MCVSVKTSSHGRAAVCPHPTDRHTLYSTGYEFHFSRFFNPSFVYRNLE